MKLFVDDMRECPKGWTPARTVTEAIRILSTRPVEEVSLDHDIGCRLVTGQEHSSNETFEPVARYLFLMCTQRFYRGDTVVRIHTGNIQAGKKMADILGIPYDNRIYNPKDYE